MGERTPVEKEFAVSGARIAYVEWGDPADETLLFLHATGFHARCWDEVIRRLPAETHVLAVDLRCHGRSEKTGLLTNWQLQANDIDEFVNGLDLKRLTGIGHSMGGYCTVYAAALNPQRYSRLLLIDPVMMAPEAYELWGSESNLLSAEEHPVARRKNHWTGWQEMFDRFKDRTPYSLWDPKVLEDYCRYGIRPRADGNGFELACPPASEASVYMNSLSRPLYDLTGQVTCPVTVLRAKARDPEAERDVMDFSMSPTWEGVAASFSNGKDVYLPHFTHFIPMQDPGFIARCILDEEKALAEEAARALKAPY